MAKKSGQKIEELYISLGLDISELDADFALADKTVNEAMADLNRRKTQIKLQAEIDTNKLTGAAAATDALTIKEKALTKELDLQRQRVALVTAEYKNTVKAKGENSVLAQKMQTNLLREQQAYTKLEAQIRKMNAEIGKTSAQIKAVPPMSGFKNIASEVAGLKTGFGALNAKTAAFIGLMSTGAGLLNLTNGAMQSGESLYQLSKKLNMTTAEASKMKMIFDMGGVDTQAIVERLATLDKGVISAGAAGNETTKSMRKFGISLQDAEKNLLPMNQQLDQLSIGYKNAAANGQVEAYIAEVLGSEGAKLIPILEQYEELAMAAERIKTTGLLNPEESHKLFIEWKILNAEAGQLKSALGAAFVPVAKEVMPSLIDGTTSLVKAIRENKEEIVAFAESIGSIASSIGATVKGTGILLDSIGVNAKNFNQGLKRTEWMEQNHQTESKIASAVLPVFGSSIQSFFHENEYQEYLKQIEQKKEADDQALKAKIERNKAEQQANREKAAEAFKLQELEQNEELKKQMVLDEAYHKTHSRLENELYDLEQKTRESIRNGTEPKKAKEEAQKQRLAIVKKYNNERIAAEKEVQESLFSLTHNDLENSLHALEEKEKEYRKRGVNETLLTQQTEAAKAKIMKDFQDNTLSKIDAVFKTNLQNRLDAIEREKEAWKQKGVEEVKATEWAEHEKSAARKKEAMSILTSQKKEFDIFKKAMQGQTGGFDGGMKSLSPDSTPEERMQVAQREIMKMKFKELGITSEDLAFMTPEYMEMFEQIKKNIDEAPIGIPQGLGFPSYIPDPNSQIRYRDLGQEEMDKLNYTTPAAQNIQNMTKQDIQISVNIDSPIVQDDEMIMQIADTAADKIKTAIKQEIGGDQNSY